METWKNLFVFGSSLWAVVIVGYTAVCLLWAPSMLRGRGVERDRKGRNALNALYIERAVGDLATRGDGEARRIVKALTLLKGVLLAMAALCGLALLQMARIAAGG
jgi:hypothetical protein